MPVKAQAGLTEKLTIISEILVLTKDKLYLIAEDFLNSDSEMSNYE
ncbi:hypothetical protein [Halalkalibacter akibai]|nr:hypothetical protein [Halalkalibacter akibai]